MPCGILALDIDGTIVHKHQPPSIQVAEYLTSLAREGWIIFFATGRTVRWSLEHLSSLPFSFFLAPYNGACLYVIPENTVLQQAFLDRSRVIKLAPFSAEFGSVIYEAGGEERIFYTEKMFSTSVRQHLQNRQINQKEQWEVLGDLTELPEMEVASVRFFLQPDEAYRIAKSIIEQTNLRAPTMKDSFWDALRIVQVTSIEASKGQALLAVRKKFPAIPVIAAGDDCNDVDLLLAADVGIAMASAPEELKLIASIIATGGSESIIDAIQDAILLARA